MNKLNDKQAFFALYIDQQVYRNDVDKTGYVLDHWCLYSKPLENGYLELTSLSDITDEHAIEVAKMCFSGEESQTSQAGRMLAMNLLLDKPSWFIPVCAIAVCDFLRRNGYLVPYASYSTQQLLDLGWVKLRTNN